MTYRAPRKYSISEQFKTAILVIPVLGTYAHTFDVGYFSGIGINYYSVFSACQNTLDSALQVAPMDF